MASLLIKTKRVYDLTMKEDEFRILVDRLWPRGLTKEKARIDLWLKEIAPSDDLRKWFAHDPKKWNEFRRKYEIELDSKRNLLSKIKQIEKEKGTVTLLYSAKDEEHNNAVALCAVLERE
jgi:uncharacterized protein YeaO (DUF488 family)